jgi:hypothetical protein
MWIEREWRFRFPVIAIRQMLEVAKRFEESAEHKGRHIGSLKRKMGHMWKGPWDS